MNLPSTHFEGSNVRLDVISNINQTSGIGGLADVALDYFGAPNGTYCQNQVEMNGVFTQGIPIADGMRTPLPIYQPNNDNQGKIPDSYGSYNLNTNLYNCRNVDVMNNCDVAPNPLTASHNSFSRPGDVPSNSIPQNIQNTIPTIGMVSQHTTLERSKSIPKFRLNRPAPLNMSSIRDYNPFKLGETTPQIPSSIILDKSTPNQILFENVCKFFTDTPTVWFGNNNSSMDETRINRENTSLPSTNPPHEKTNYELHEVNSNQILPSSPPVSFEEIVENNNLSSDPSCQQAFVKQLKNMPLKNLDSIEDTSSLPDMEVNTSSPPGSHVEEVQTVEKTDHVKPPKVNARKKHIAKNNELFNDLVKSCFLRNFSENPLLHHWFVLKIYEHGLSISDFLLLNEELIILNSKIDKGLIVRPYGPKELNLLNNRKQVHTYRVMKEKMLFLVNPKIHPKKCYKSNCFYSIIGFKSDKELSNHVFHFHFEQLHPCSKCREMYHTRESRDKHFSICHNSNEGEIDISKEYMLAKWGQKDQDTLKFAKMEFLRQYQVLRRPDSSKPQLQRHRRQRKASSPKQKTLSTSSQDKLKKQLTQLSQ